MLVVVDDLWSLSDGAGQQRELAILAELGIPARQVRRSFWCRDEVVVADYMDLVAQHGAIVASGRVLRVTWVQQPSQQVSCAIIEEGTPSPIFVGEWVPLASGEGGAVQHAASGQSYWLSPTGVIEQFSDWGWADGPCGRQVRAWSVQPAAARALIASLA